MLIIENFCKNDLRFVKCMPMIYVKFVRIMFIISKKKWEALLSYRHFNNNNIINNNNANRSR